MISITVVEKTQRCSGTGVSSGVGSGARKGNREMHTISFTISPFVTETRVSSVPVVAVIPSSAAKRKTIVDMVIFLLVCNGVKNPE